MDQEHDTLRNRHIVYQLGSGWRLEVWSDDCLVFAEWRSNRKAIDAIALERFNLDTSEKA